MQITTKRFCRSKTDSVIGGVVGSLGTDFGIASMVIRLGWLVFTLAGGAGVLAYLVAWTVIPDENGRRTIMPLLLLTVGILLPFVLILLWLVPVTVTTTR